MQPGAGKMQVVCARNGMKMRKGISQHTRFSPEAEPFGDFLNYIQLSKNKVAIVTYAIAAEKRLMTP